ncbi:ferritin-like domain-containing protein [Hymenobacter aerilatus]|uniref:Ferritin-like domain-containing protein n=1 Tax=Hymenobacter aerilatus TaxID=2932251 RepID=A0A8T9T114_9BACT|nr:ferritin-like domain-containing protein [Hymenobacter aerilatus]UOR05719.1 ferritin-like domain-containing protein [Hymenobacter aerilatus]
MSKVMHDATKAQGLSEELQTPLERRTFLRYTGLGLAMGGLALAGCNDVMEDVVKTQDASANATDMANMVDVGSGDVGVLNYAYALEQLEAAFYAQVLQTQYYNSTSAPQRVALRDIEAHERIHREFFKQAITAAGATPIKDLEVDFSSIDFRTKQGVLSVAKAFEDLGVAAYNGAGKLIKTAAYLAIAGKIVSVEARHAAIIRDFLEYNTFVGADVVDQNGLEKSMTPAQVVAIANNFLKEGSKLNVSNLPTE